MQTQKKIKRACNPSHGFGEDKVQDIPILCNDQRGRASYNSMLAIAAGSALIWKFVFLL